MLKNSTEHQIDTSGKVDVFNARKAMVNVINHEEQFLLETCGASDAEKQISDAKMKLDSILEAVDVSLLSLQSRQGKVKESSKAVCGSLKDSAEKLSTGLQRVEKAANFDRLERYVELLERASAAMTTLAELDKAGKLAKIAEALK